MTATRPQPRPGVLDIAPYIPGKSNAPGVAKVFKLSSNETPLGREREHHCRLRTVAEHLEDYPDGSASALREAIGDVFGLDPARIVCGAGSDDLLNLIARAYLSRRRRGDPHHAWLPGLSDRHARHRRQAGGRAGEEFHRRRRRDPQAACRRAPRSCSWPTRTIRPGPTFRSTRSSACTRACRRNVLLVLDAAYAEYVQRNDYESGIELVATSENVVMCRTFSKIYGLAALRLGWMYGPAPCRGRDQPHPRAVQRQRAGDRRRHRGDPRHRPCREIARAQYALARLAHRGNRQARSAGDAERRQFRAHPFPETQRASTAKDADAFLTKRGLILRQVGAYKLPNALRMSVGTEEANRLVVKALAEFLGKSGVSKPAPLFNRLALIGVGLIGSSIARAARAQGAVRSIVATARSPPRASASPSSASPIRWWRAMPPRSKAPISSSSAFRSAPAARWPRRSARISRPAPPSPTSARSRARSFAIWRRICRRPCISCRRIRSPAPNIPAPMQALPNCS